MGKLYPGCHTQDLNYRYDDAGSSPSGSDCVVWGNRQYYQARGYAEITKTKVTSVPVYLSTTRPHDENKQLMKIPDGAMPYAMRMVLPDDNNNTDTLQPSGGQDTLYAYYGGTTNLAGNAFPPRLASGEDLIYDAKSVALSASTAYFANPQSAVSGEKTVNLYTSGANGIQLNPASASSAVKVGVEIEFCLPYSDKNVEYDKIVFF